jgi:subtilisin family serine protease
MEFAGATTSKGVSGTLVDCGLAATAADCPASVRGNIALIQRGSYTFSQKVTSAMDAGAVGAIVYNNASGNFNGTLGTDTTADGRRWIPAVSVSLEDGTTLKNTQVGNAVTLFNIPTSWDYFSGTSMATPHVTGAAALALAANPSLTTAQLTNILTSTATDIGRSGYDVTFGYGLVNAKAAADKAAGTP